MLTPPIDKSFVSELITTYKDLLCVDRVVSSAKISAHECDKTEGKSLKYIKNSIGPRTDL